MNNFTYNKYFSFIEKTNPINHSIEELSVVEVLTQLPAAS